MSYINLDLSDITPVCNGKQITFRAPCSSESVTGVKIKGVNYQLLNSSNESKYNFVQGAMLSVLIDEDNKRAYLQNTTPFPEERPNNVIYGVRISKSSNNYYTSVSYIQGTDAYGMNKGSSEWDSMPIFKDIRPCIVNKSSKKVEAYCTDTDITRFISTAVGSSTSELQTDVGKYYRMVEFSKGYMKIVNNTNSIDIYVSNTPQSGYTAKAFSYESEGDCDKFYLGLNKSVYNSGSFYTSPSLLSPTGSSYALNATSWRNYQNSAGVCSLNIYQLSWIHVLLIIKYGALYIDKYLGTGAGETGGSYPFNGSIDRQGRFSNTNSGYAFPVAFCMTAFYGYNSSLDDSPNGYMIDCGAIYIKNSTTYLFLRYPGYSGSAYTVNSTNYEKRITLPSDPTFISDSGKINLYALPDECILLGLSIVRNSSGEITNNELTSATDLASSNIISLMPYTNTHPMVFGLQTVGTLQVSHRLCIFDKQQQS